VEFEIKIRKQQQYRQMRFSTSTLLALVATLLTTSSLVTATPIPCNDATRDAILRGDLDPSACCSYGKCRGGSTGGDVVVQGG